MFVKNIQQLEGEITDWTEWVKYDGDSVSFIRSGWSGIIGECLEAGTYPVMIFFEKLGHGEKQLKKCDRLFVKKEEIAGLQAKAAVGQ